MRRPRSGSIVPPRPMSGRLARNVSIIVATSVGLVVLVAATLGWLGWTLLSQEDAILRQRSHDRVEQAADALVAGFLRTVADRESWLREIPATLPADAHAHLDPGATLVMFSRNGVETLPRRALPYYPNLASPTPVDPAVFRESDMLEFQRGHLPGAVTLLEVLVTSRHPQIRSEALLRLARVHNKNGHPAAALATYAQLHDDDSVSAAEVPY